MILPQQELPRVVNSWIQDIEWWVQGVQEGNCLMGTEFSVLQEERRSAAG